MSAIVDGTYPTQRNEAKDLAALQVTRLIVFLFVSDVVRDRNLNAKKNFSV